MPTEPTKKPRKPRRNFAEERAKLVMHCKLAITIIGGLNAVEGQQTDFKPIMS